MLAKIACLLVSGLVLAGCAKDSEPPITAKSRFAAGQMAEAQGNMPWAIKQYQEAGKMDPKSPAPQLRLGIVCTSTGQWDTAVAAWKRYIALTPGAGGYANLGFTLESARRFDEAAGAYRAGIAKDPASEPCRVNYGLMLARQGRMEAAGEQLGTVLKAAEVHYNLASVLESQGKKLGARAEFQKALADDPQMADAKARLAALNASE